MATFRKTYSNGSTSSGTTAKCVELTNKSRSQSEISPNIPGYSILNNVIISFEWRTDKSLTSGDCQVSVNRDPSTYFSTASLGNQIGSASNSKNSYVSVYRDKNTAIEDTNSRLTDFFNSGKKNVGEYSGSYSITIWFSATITRNFYWKNMYMEFDYTPPTYVISLIAGTGGTVSGAGTYEVGTSATIKATPNAGYKFVKWSDGNTSAERAITITEDDISAHVTNLSYTAVFELDKVYVTYDSIFNFRRWADNNLASWALLEVSNVTDTGFTGKALVDDAYTTECRPLIPVTKGNTYTFECATSGGAFEFFIFNCDSSGAWADFTYGNTNKFNFTPSNDYVSIRCDVVGTGVVVNFSDFKMYPADCPYMSDTVGAADRSDSNAWSIPTPTRSGYKFLGWYTQPNGGGSKYTASSTFPTTDLVLYSHWELQKYTVNFKNQDGTIIKTSTIQAGSTLGTLPTVSRSGYTFAGWIPCAPVIKTDGSVLDSYQYNGGTAYPLDKKYKYTNNLSVHIEAYMSNWEDIVQRQIISCTEGGGWGIGYQANTTGHGSELYAGGYKGIDLGFGTAGKFSNNTWYLFDLVFSNGVFEVYQDGVKKGSQTTTNTSISYNADNTIFVGAEAAKNATTPAGNYFKGYISNVFIANQGTRLEIATTSTVVNNNTDYYPIWRKNTTFTATFKNHDGTVLQTVSVEYGSTPSYTGTTPTKSSTAEYSYSFSGWSPSVGAITSATTYTAQFTATKRKYNLTASAGTGGSVTGGGTYEYGKTATLTAIPNSGYKFKQWSDGVTTATRSVTVTGNATYTAYFEVDKINKIYVGTAQPKAIYVGTTPVKAVYIGTTKIYG